MKELNLLVENYFSPALGATDILRLVEQVMLQEAYDIPIASDADVDSFDNEHKVELKALLSYLISSGMADTPIAGSPDGKFKIRVESEEDKKAVKDWMRVNTPQLKYKFGLGSVGKVLKISNKGDVLEGLLGVALFISLKGEVPTNESIIDTLEELRKEEDNSKSKKKISKSLTETITRSVDKEDRKVDVTLNIALNIGNFNDMMNSEKRSLLQTEYSNVIKYAESDYFKDVRDELIFDKNAPPNNVTINVVGALEQTTSKADLRILKDGNVVLSQSLKNGSRTLGQVGGKKEEMVFDFIKRVFDRDFPSNLKKYYIKLLTEKCDADTSRRNILWVVNDMFNYIYTHAQGKLNDGDYKKHLMSALSYAALGDAQGDDATIELLNFEKNEFRLLDFKKVMSDSLLDGLSLGLDFNHTGGFPEGPNPEPPKLTIFDTNNGTDDKPSSANRLFQFRPKYENKNCYFRFYLEYGNRIDTILMDAFEEGQAKKRQQIIDREEDASV